MREQRMVAVVMRHLSGIQKGIQAAHAIVEYEQKFGDTLEYKRWAKKDKTLIVLEANTSDQLEETYQELKKLKYPVEKFIEPDLSNGITAICFLISETVYNTKKFPDGDSMEDLALRRIKNQFILATN